ncbi:MAG TPA: hypothetical protein VKU00_26370 [Chthonomonadaceae bacterium]|nr:hypothetical protein [Chthonomonadaceae bacterium]
MAQYLYECPQHGATRARFPLGAAPPSISCFCGLDAQRVFTVPQIVPTPFVMSEENKRGLAIADARRKERDAAYEQDYARPMPPLA